MIDKTLDLVNELTRQYQRREGFSQEEAILKMALIIKELVLGIHDLRREVKAIEKQTLPVQEKAKRKSKEG